MYLIILKNSVSLKSSIFCFIYYYMEGAEEKQEIKDLKKKIIKLKQKNHILKEKVKTIGEEDTQIILNLDKKIFDLREENRLLQAKIKFLEIQLEDLNI